MIKDLVNIPVFLVGGLKQENVLDAVRLVQPYGLDICSGLRTNGKLDEEKMKLFFEKVNKYNFRPT